MSRIHTSEYKTMERCGKWRVKELRTTGMLWWKKDRWEWVME